MPEALNLLDDRRTARREEGQALLRCLERELPFPGAARIGITGSPGAGKSTLLDALVRALRPRGETLAIIAVDPSSQRSGGALLGDRIRVRSAAGDPGVFFRSMAARERLGGLSDATRAGTLVLAAAFDRVFVETVGVGQSETEVAALVDSLVYVVNPGSGDTLQFMKAGILELPDVFAVNKSDLGGEAERTASELVSGLGLTQVEGRWQPPVLRLSAREGGGVEALVEALDRHREHLVESGELSERRRRGRDAFVQGALQRRYGSYGVAQLGGPESIAERLADRGGNGSFQLLEELSREIEESLQKQR